MNDIIPLVGPWFWWIIAGTLLIGELLAPGIFMLWLAIAAGLTGLADVVFALSWQSEVALFAVLSVVLVYLSWRFVMMRQLPHSDQPHLNQRINAYVGRTVALDVAIRNGMGKVRIDDALWDVEGPDLPAHSRVRITGVKGMHLVGEKAE